MQKERLDANNEENLDSYLIQAQSSILYNYIYYRFYSSVRVSNYSADLFNGGSPIVHEFSDPGKAFSYFFPWDRNVIHIAEQFYCPIVIFENAICYFSALKFFALLIHALASTTMHDGIF
jgi:hypothetical protein